jgi:diaminopropionate ammonia-lyase
LIQLGHVHKDVPKCPIHFRLVIATNFCHCRTTSSAIFAMEYSHYSNIRRLQPPVAQAAKASVQNLADWRVAVDEIRTWPEYEPQPLRKLPHLANSLQIGNLFVKDESQRFGPDLASFKALGAPFATYKVLADQVYSQTGMRPTSSELRTNKHHDITKRITVCVATDGNQGRGLAYGAKIFGCNCVVYIHSHVSSGRADMMKHLGATVIRIDGEYEASVRRAKEDARINEWHFVSSTSWNDFEDRIPQNVMSAYRVVVEEALDMVPCVNDITHVFVCGGVGSVAAAVFLGVLNRFNSMQRPNKLESVSSLPRFIVVEPSEADCLLQSAKRGQICQSEGSLRTIMAGLACRAPSPAAWKILDWLTSDFVAVPDTYAIDGMRTLAMGCQGDIPVVCGESSGAIVGVLNASATDKGLRAKLGLDDRSQALVLSLEGATDPQIYERLVTKSANLVVQAQEQFLEDAN